MPYPYEKVSTREEFSLALDAVFRLDKRLRSTEALTAMAMQDARGKAKCKCMANNVISRKEAYLTQWDAAKDEAARDVVVGSVFFHPEDYEIAESEIDQAVGG